MEKDMMKILNGIFGSSNNYEVVRCPKDINELEDFIKKSMNKNRILIVHINDQGDDIAPEWHPKFVEYITTLALKYRPWQFRWLSQESGSIEINWVEIEEWRYKYKKL